MLVDNVLGNQIPRVASMRDPGNKVDVLGFAYRPNSSLTLSADIPAARRGLFTTSIYTYRQIIGESSGVNF